MSGNPGWEQTPPRSSLRAQPGQRLRRPPLCFGPGVTPTDRCGSWSNMADRFPDGPSSRMSINPCLNYEGIGLFSLAGQQPPSMWTLSRNISRRRSSEYPSVLTTESQSDTS